MKRYLLNILIWIDTGLNVLVFAGSPYETVSGRVGRRRDKGDRWACLFCKLFDRIDPRHCDKSMVPDIGENASNWWHADNLRENRYLIAAAALWLLVFVGFISLWRLL